MGVEPTTSGATFRRSTVELRSQRKVKVSNLRPVSRGYGLATRPIASLATFQVEPPTMVHGPQIVHKRVLPVVQAVPAEDGGLDPHTFRYDPFSRRSGRACPVHLPWVVLLAFFAFFQRRQGSHLHFLRSYMVRVPCSFLAVSLLLFSAWQDLQSTWQRASSRSRVSSVRDQMSLGRMPPATERGIMWSTSRSSLDPHSAHGPFRLIHSSRLARIHSF